MSGTEEWTAGEWLIQEMPFALANKKKIILLKEQGVKSVGGIQGDLEYIEFDREALHRSVVKVIQMVWSLNPGKITVGSNQPPQMSMSLLEAAVASAPGEPHVRLLLARQRQQSGQVEAAMREVDEILRLTPEFVLALQ
jgi:hypothetical protein